MGSTEKFGESRSYVSNRSLFPSGLKFEIAFQFVCTGKQFLRCFFFQVFVTTCVCQNHLCPLVFFFFLFLFSLPFSPPPMHTDEHETRKKRGEKEDQERHHPTSKKLHCGQRGGGKLSFVGSGSGNNAKIPTQKMQIKIAR